jgi:hypothetical protein
LAAARSSRCGATAEGGQGRSRQSGGPWRDYGAGRDCWRRQGLAGERGKGRCDRVATEAQSSGRGRRAKICGGAPLAAVCQQGDGRRKEDGRLKNYSCVEPIIECYSKHVE